MNENQIGSGEKSSSSIGTQQCKSEIRKIHSTGVELHIHDTNNSLIV